MKLNQNRSCRLCGFDKRLNLNKYCLDSSSHNFLNFVPILRFQFFLNWLHFNLFSVVSNKQYNFYNKLMYPVLGFKLMTS